MRPLGTRQLELLMLMSLCGSVVTARDATVRKLLGRGLLTERSAGGLRITPAGLRTLADELEAGRVDAVLAEQQRRWVERQEQRQGKD